MARRETKKSKFKQFNQRGFDHILVAVFCFVLSGIIGTFLIVISHAMAAPQWKGILEEGSSASGYCLTASGSMSDAHVVLDPCSKTDDSYQDWNRTNIQSATVMGVSDVQEFTLSLATGSNECLNNPKGSKTIGTAMQLYPCSSTDPASVWVWGTDMSSKDLSSHQLINLASVSGTDGLCLDDANGVTTALTKTQVNSCKTTSQTNQEWFEDSAPDIAGGETLAAGVQPIALVYRGPASCCSEAVYNLLKDSPYNFNVEYIGPNEKLKLTSSSFKGAALYAQPGGNGTVQQGVTAVGGSTTFNLIKNFVNGGGRYVGFCMGAYFAGTDPGMGLLSPGNTNEYVGSPGATVTTTGNTVVTVNWRGVNTIQFFQDGPYIIPSGESGERIIAKFPNGEVDALTKPYGNGRVGVVGSHPEATRGWFSTSLWAKDPDDANGMDRSEGLDLINDVMTP